jgi:hypothetical protein
MSSTQASPTQGSGFFAAIAIQHLRFCLVRRFNVPGLGSHQQALAARSDLPRFHVHGCPAVHFFWCLYAPVIDSLVHARNISTWLRLQRPPADSLPTFIHRDWPLNPFRVRAEVRQRIREAGVNQRSPSRWPPPSA